MPLDDEADVWLLEESVQIVPVESLSIADSPRQGGVNQEHVRILLDSETSFPPIVVHRKTMRVIDGIHRLRAAVLRGQREVEVRFFDGTEADAFLLAVRSNVRHGLPLPLADRRAAAGRILSSHPHLSDRATARISGLSAKTVAALRQRSTDDIPQSNVRLGQDGRARPMHAAAGRIRASELIAANPGMSVREIARAAGISVGTAHDVRERLRTGRDLLPDRHRETIAGTAEAGDSGDRGADGDRARGESTEQPAVSPVSRLRSRAVSSTAGGRDWNPELVLRILKRDPSLRFTEPGRALLRMFEAHTVVMDSTERLLARIPSHCAEMVVALADGYARSWQDFAQRLRAFDQDGSSRISG